MKKAEKLNGIIQISTSSVRGVGETECNFVTTALCDNGTVWIKYDTDSVWYLINEPISYK